MNDIDRANVAWMKRVIARYGWPGRTLVGKDGAYVAWLLVQHADKDRPFQKRCLRLMEAAAAKGEVNKTDVAFLVDRVLVGEGKKQRYGTQTLIVNGELIVDPIEDEANVDKRRAEVGMMPLKDYLRSVREMFLGKTPPAKDKP